MRAVVLGAGGHARVCLDLLLEQDGLEVVGCLGEAGDGRLQRPVLGGDDALPRLLDEGVQHVFVAVGSNRLRQRLSAEASALGAQHLTAVSQAARLSPSVHVGAGAAVMAGAVVNAYAQVGTGAIVNTGATVDHDCVLGAFTHVAPGCHLAGDVVVGEGAFLGTGAAVVPGVRVGAGAVVGAGSVVLRDVPSGATVVGNPGAVIKQGNPS